MPLDDSKLDQLLSSVVSLIQGQANSVKAEKEAREAHVLLMEKQFRLAEENQRATQASFDSILTQAQTALDAKEAQIIEHKLLRQDQSEAIVAAAAHAAATASGTRSKSSASPTFPVLMGSEELSVSPKCKYILLLALCLTLVVAFNALPPPCPTQTTMDSFQVQKLSPEVTQYTSRLTYAQALEHLESSLPFREALFAILAQSGLEAYFFETPGVNRTQLPLTPFEFVLVNAPSLVGARPDSQAFEHHFAKCSQDEAAVVAFANLGRDAQLVAPCPLKDDQASQSCFAHLATFMGHGNQIQIHALWRRVAQEMRARVEEQDSRQVWLSTSGLGISWLHGKTIGAVKLHLEKLADKFADFANLNGLVLNASKTEIMIGGKVLEKDLANITIAVDGGNVKPSKQAQHLPRGQYLRQMAEGLLGGKLGYAMATVIRPRIDDDSPISTHVKAKQVALNAVARTITGTRKVGHINLVDLLTNAGMTSINHRATMATAMEMWKAYTSNDGPSGTCNTFGRLVFPTSRQAEPTRPEPQKEVVEQEKKPEPQNLEEGEEAPSQSKKPKWFEEDAAKTTKVYVSGLPAEVTEDTFVAFMSKCGMIEIDVRSNKPKARLYMDKASGTPKGDGLCTYVKQESVQLALQILDGSKWAESEVRVERAKFEMKGEKYDARLKPKKLKKKELELLKKKHEKYLAWEVDRLRGERSKKEKVIVVKNLFDPEEFDEDASRILEYSQKLREQCAKFGTVKKVTVHDKHPEGVAQVWFETAEEADMAISMVHGRLFFNQKVMKAETWDGKTKYKVKESEEEERERLAKWEKSSLTGKESRTDEFLVSHCSQPSSKPHLYRSPE
eukprot:snap_masked-scaffold270_size230592-processed-gene-1.17 protein:Tk10978 transcript:snap_masked-scaffold270_size230592-processed-gene-1.17-mRNA-1 annotation:"hiv tat-specific factor 1 homolog"